jgi:hypothetical protein
MLIQFFDADGRETWINPIQVRVVRAKKGLLGGVKGTEVWMSYSSTSSSVEVPLPTTEVAERLNAAMPAVWFGDSTDDDEGMVGDTPVSVE